MSVSETTDEHNNKSWSFTDAQGRIVLKKQQAEATIFTETYYVYDELGQMRAVIPPMGTSEVRIGGITAVTASFMKKWCFRYEYDARHRVIRKWLPGGNVEEMVYNQRDQVILHRDSEQAANETWLFTKYDALGRPIVTGRWYNDNDPSETRDNVQADADNVSLQQWEDVVIATNPGQVEYSLTKSFPTDVYEIDTRTYYDVYTFSDLVNRSFVAESNVAAPERSTGLGQVTGRAERVFDYNASTAANPWLTTVLFYNERGQLIQTQADLYPSGTERSTNEVDFAGHITSSLQTHTFPQAAVPIHVVRQENTYDPMGRLLEIQQSVTDKNASGQVVNTQASIIIARYEYNEIGQLIDKKLHSDDNGVSFLQSVDYRYNIRGWLTNINNRSLSNNEWLDDTDPNSDNLVV